MVSKAPPPDDLLAVRHVSKHFAGVNALSDVSLSMGAGEICCLAGENGSGKSTLINIIAGVLRPDTGSVLVGGKTIRPGHPLDAVRAGVQVIYQDFSLFPNLSVAENLMLNSLVEKRCRWVRRRAVAAEARRALARIGCDLDVKLSASALSVAERQQVAIARALWQEARLIIMDEPTTALTAREVAALFTLIRSLQAQGVSILFVSHKLNEVLRISRRIMILRNGRLVEEGPVDAFDQARLSFCMTGQQLDDASGCKKIPAADGAALLQVEDLCKTDAFQDISFALQEGEILGITGLLGCGRHALAESLFGLAPADGGRVSVRGKTVRLNSVQSALRAGFGYVPQDRLTEGVFLDQSVARNITASRMRALVNRAGLLRFRALGRCVRHWIEKLRIKAPSSAAPAQTLSGGNQQKLVLAKWLAMQAKVMMLNGPTAGVDVGAKLDIHRQIRTLAGQGAGVLVFSDDLPELARLCHRILLMHRGRMVFSFQDDLLTEAVIEARMAELV